MVFLYFLVKGEQIGIKDKFNDYLDLQMTKVNDNRKLETTDLETYKGKIPDKFTNLGALQGLDLDKVYCLPKSFDFEVQDRDLNIIINKCNYLDRNQKNLKI